MKRDTTVLFMWKPEDKLKKYLSEGISNLNNVKLIFPDDEKEETLLRYAPEVDIIVGWRPSLKLLNTAIKLSFHIMPGAGVQHLVEMFREINKERKIILINGHGNSYFTAQHAVAMLLTLTNRIIIHHQRIAEGNWRKFDEEPTSTPMRNRKIGLLGYGAINQKVHQFLSGFDVEFAICRINWDRQQNTLPTPVKRFIDSQLHDFLEFIDTLIVAVPQTSKSIGMIKKKELELLGSEGLLVNVSRGIVIDEKDFFETLNVNTIAGAAIDVWYNYNPEPDKDGLLYPSEYHFHELDNVILSPHRAASPFEDLKRWDEVIENITRFADGKDKFINVVDIDREY
ncbi:MAG: hypothetical protein GY855_05495 [candidate division Zixibacteria bacterium]|nr:hypothetical protein [candidate division Zixibacteria bacterium]